MQTWIIGNWKLQGSQSFISEYLQVFVPLVSQGKAGVRVGLCPPAPYVYSLAQQLSDQQVQPTSIAVGGQNISTESSGAFTGEVSAQMLEDTGATLTLVGHSERRQLFAETDEVVAAKVQQAYQANLIPVLCVGETLAEREADQTLQVVEKQLSVACSKLTAEQWSTLVIAYEPVWAIGTGLTATPDQAQEVHAFISKMIGQLQGEGAVPVPLLYGGSVKPNNAAELLEQADVHGLLVGGASLKPSDFADIVNCA